MISELESYEEAPEFLIGGSFGDACICNAFAYYSGLGAAGGGGAFDWVKQRHVNSRFLYVDMIFTVGVWVETGALLIF